MTTCVETWNGDPCSRPHGHEGYHSSLPYTFDELLTFLAEQSRMGHEAAMEAEDDMGRALGDFQGVLLKDVETKVRHIVEASS